MRISLFLGIIFYILVFSLLGGLIIGLALELIDVSSVVFLLEKVCSELDLRIILGLIGLLLILISIAFAQMIMGKIQMERTIAFPNPQGPVSISLSAVEDLIRRLSVQVPEIKELRPEVIATKKGLQVNLRLIMRQETNIPDLTVRLQELVKNRIQELLGVEESITIRIHVAKIVLSEEKEKKKEESSKEPNIPFRDYKYD